MRFTFDTKNLIEDGPIIDALRNGKTIQYWDGGTWADYTETGSIDLSVVRERRIKPEPTLREWNENTAPVGALIRRKSWESGGGGPSQILCASNRGVRFYDQWNETYAKLFSFAQLIDPDFEHSTDKGKNWSPCGVFTEE